MKYLIVIFIYVLFVSEIFSQGKKNDEFDELEKLSLEELVNIKITGVSKFAENMDEAPANSIIISEQQIKDRLYFHLTDVLKDINYVDIVDNARGFGEYYTIKGIGGNDRFLVLMDGKKINPTNGTFLSVGNSIPVSQAKRIEIISGPSSAIYGADAFSAIINIVTKDVHYAEENQKKLNFEFDSHYGSFNTLYSNFSMSYRYDEDISFYASVGLFNSEGINLVGRDAVYDTILKYKEPLENKFEQPITDHNIFLKGSFGNLTLSYFRQHFDEGNALGQQTRSIIYDKSDKWALTNNILGLNYISELGEKTDFTWNMDYIYFEQDPDTQFHKWKKDKILEESFSQYMTGINHTIRGDANLKHTFNDEFYAILGLEFENTSSIPPYANDQVLAQSLKYEGETAKIIDDSLMIHQQRYGVFLQTSYSPTDYFSLLLGNRFDYFSLYDNSFNPRLGIILNPTKKTNIKLLYGRAFQAPSLFYQYEQWGATTAVMHSESEVQKDYPNHKLENQKIVTYEVNTNHKFNNSLSFELSVYFSKLKNLIERNEFTTDSTLAYNKYFSIPDSSVYSIGFRNENIGRQEVIGLNFGVNWKINKNIDLNMQYAYTKTQVLKDGDNEAIPRVAPNKFTLLLDWRNILDYINLSVSYRHFGRINNRNKEVFPDGYQPGFDNIDMKIRTKYLWDYLSIYTKINNLLNSDYSHGGLIDQTTYLPTIPQPKLNFYLGFNLKIK